MVFVENEYQNEHEHELPIWWSEQMEQRKNEKWSEEK